MIRQGRTGRNPDPPPPASTSGRPRPRSRRRTGRRSPGPARPASRSQVCTWVRWWQVCSTRRQNVQIRCRISPPKNGRSSSHHSGGRRRELRQPPPRQPDVPVDVGRHRRGLAGRQQVLDRRLLGADELGEEPPLREDLVGQDRPDRVRLLVRLEVEQVVGDRPPHARRSCSSRWRRWRRGAGRSGPRARARPRRGWRRTRTSWPLPIPRILEREGAGSPARGMRKAGRDESCRGHARFAKVFPSREMWKKRPGESRPNSHVAGATIRSTTLPQRERAAAVARDRDHPRRAAMSRRAARSRAMAPRYRGRWRIARSLVRR